MAREGPQRLSGPVPRSRSPMQLHTELPTELVSFLVSRPSWISAPTLLAAFCIFKAKNKDWSVAGTRSPSPPDGPAGQQGCSVSLQGTEGSRCPDTARSSCCSPGWMELEVKLSSQQVQLGTGSLSALGRPLLCRRGLGEGAETSLPTQHSREEHEHATLTRCFTGQPCLARPRGAQTCSSCAGTRGWLSSSLCPGLRLPGLQSWWRCFCQQSAISLAPCRSSLHAVCLRLFLLEVPGCECPHQARRTSVGSEPGQLICCSAGGAGVGTHRWRVKSTRCHRESLYRCYVCLSRSVFP